MNAAHYHLLINHVPILLTFFALAVLVWGMAIRNDSVKKVALAGFFLAGLFVLIAFQTGESAEEIVEEIPGVTHDSIEAHEEAAEISWWLTLALGVGGAAGLIMFSRDVKGRDKMVWALLLFGILTAGSLAYTAWEGGHIRHTEIRNSEASADLIIGEAEIRRSITKTKGGVS